MKLSYGYEMDDPDVIARATSDNGFEVLLVSAPASSIDGHTGPIAIPSFSPRSIVVVLAAEFIDRFCLDDSDTIETMRDKIGIVGDLVRGSIDYGMAYLESTVDE